MANGSSSCAVAAELRGSASSRHPGPGCPDPLNFGGRRGQSSRRRSGMAGAETHDGGQAVLVTATGEADLFERARALDAAGPAASRACLLRTDSHAPNVAAKHLGVGRPVPGDAPDPPPPAAWALQVRGRTGRVRGRRQQHSGCIMEAGEGMGTSSEMRPALPPSQTLSPGQR